jgi:hypothetical protein
MCGAASRCSLNAIFYKILRVDAGEKRREPGAPIWRRATAVAIVLGDKREET